MSATTHDWIRPGADVVIYADNRQVADNPTFYVTQVATVAKQSFKVAKIDHRFQLDTLATKDFGGTWRYRCVPVGDARHVAMQAAARRHRVTSAASDAADQWRRDRTGLAQVDAVVAAFTALRDELSR